MWQEQGEKHSILSSKMLWELHPENLYAKVYNITQNEKGTYRFIVSEGPETVFQRLRANLLNIFRNFNHSEA